METKEKRDPKRARFDNKRCSHCNQKGHTVEQCFHIVGYPNWYKGPRNKPPQRSSDNAARNMEQAIQENPFDEENVGSVQKEKPVDIVLMNTVCQEVMRIMKGKGSAETSYANFEGPWK